MSALILLLTSAGAVPTVGKFPLRSEQANKMAYVISEAQTGMERFCAPGQSFRVTMEVSRAQQPDKVETAGPECARREMAAIKRWLASRPPSAFLPVRKRTRYSFKVRLEWPQ